MSDPKNCDPRDDSQFFEANRTDADDTPQTSAALYEAGLAQLQEANYRLERSISGVAAFHTIYLRQSPEAIQGVTYPKAFKVWRQIQTPTSLLTFQNHVSNLKESVGSFWWPLVSPDATKRKPIYGHTLQLLANDEVYRNQHGDVPLDLKLAPIPVLPGEPDPKDPERTLTSTEVAPRAWLPRREWFAPQLQAVGIGDILTIFPAAEQDLLALIVGRAVVGRHNHQPPGWAKPIRHTSRMAAIVVGQDPGLGKSTLFDYLFTSLQACGYHKETFASMEARFNMGPIATADIIYKDDITAKGLRQFVESEKTKIIITGNGLLKVEDKGVNAVNVQPNGVIFMNTNEFNPRNVYGIDPGAADRLKLLETLRETEVFQQRLGGVSEGSPDTRPAVHIPWLAKKLQVDEKALMLWFARLCADRFLDLIQDSESPVNRLEVAVDHLSAKLRMPLHKNIDAQVFSALQLCDLAPILSNSIGRGCVQDEWLAGKRKDLGDSDLLAAMSRLGLLIGNREYLEITALIKWHYENLSNNDPLHPWLAFKHLDPSSVGAAHKVASTEPKDNGFSARTVAFFSHVTLRSGLPLTKDLVWLTQAYNQVVVRTPITMDLLDWLEVAILGLGFNKVWNNLFVTTPNTVRLDANLESSLPVLTDEQINFLKAVKP